MGINQISAGVPAQKFVNTNILVKNRRAGLKFLASLGFFQLLAAHAIPGLSDEKDDISEQLNQRAISAAANNGVLRLDDGEYWLSSPLVLEKSVSLIMSRGVKIIAKRDFTGDALVVKSGGAYASDGTSGEISGGVIDCRGLNLVGIKVGAMHRLVISSVHITNALKCGIHLMPEGNECSLNNIRCDIEERFSPAVESVGIKVEKTDCKINNAVVIGYRVGVSSVAGACYFSGIHVWNWQPAHGPLRIGFDCGGFNDQYMQCYADSFVECGFSIQAMRQSFMQCKAYYSRWGSDAGGVGFLLGSNSSGSTFVSNMAYGSPNHRLNRVFEGNQVSSSMRYGNSAWDVVHDNSEGIADAGRRR